MFFFYQDIKPGVWCGTLHPHVPIFEEKRKYGHSFDQLSAKVANTIIKHFQFIDFVIWFFFSGVSLDVCYSALLSYVYYACLSWPEWHCAYCCAYNYWIYSISSDEAVAAFLESSGEQLTELSLNNVKKVICCVCVCISLALFW